MTMIYNRETNVTNNFVYVNEDSVRVYQLTTYRLPLMILPNTKHYVIIV